MRVGRVMTAKYQNQLRFVKKGEGRGHKVPREKVVKQQAIIDFAESSYLIKKLRPLPE